MMGAIQNNRPLPYDFRFGSLFKESWQRVKGAKAPIWGGFLIGMLVMLGFNVLTFLLSLFKNTLILDFVWVIQAISIFVTYPLFVGVTYLGLRRAVDLPLRAGMVFSMYHYFWRIAGMVLLQAFMIYGLCFILVLSFLFGPDANAFSVIGTVIMRIIQTALILFIIYMGFSFAFSYLLIVEKNLGVWDAYLASFSAFNQHGLKISAALILMMLIYFLSALPFGIGLIWTIPMISIFMGVLYRHAFGVEEARGLFQ